MFVKRLMVEYMQLNKVESSVQQVKRVRLKVGLFVVERVKVCGAVKE